MTLGTYVAYSATVSTVGVSLLWWMRRRIKQTENSLAERLEHLKRFDAVRTESPVEDPSEEARERSLENLATRFALIRRLLLPSCLALILVTLAIPLLGDIPGTYVSLLVAVVGVVVGIAAKPVIENMIAAIVLSFAQPIRIGDTVIIDEQFGTIEDIGVTHTTLKLWDWRRRMIPNHHMLDHEFINCSIVDRYQWAYVEFWVAPDTDLDRVREIAMAAPRKSGQFVDYEDPRFWIMETGKEGIRCWIAAWANTPYAAWQLTHDVRTELCRQFRIEGIRTHSYRHELNSDCTQPA